MPRTAPRAPRLLWTTLALLAVILAGMTTAARADSGAGITRIWGQTVLGATRCPEPPNAATLCGPTQVAVDTAGDVWLADFVNNRVLMYLPGRTAAAKVFGQYGSFATRGCNQRPPRGARFPAAPSRYTLCEPIGVAVSREGTLYIADSMNSRILVYFHAAQKASGAPADLVLGQSTFHNTSANDTSAGGTGTLRCDRPRPASRCTLNSPMELSLTPNGDLLVPDSLNNRVLLWSAATLHRFKAGACVRNCSIPASAVWGQYGSFHTVAENNPHRPAALNDVCTAVQPPATPASACTLAHPWAAAVDPEGHLLIADTENNRILEYTGPYGSASQNAVGVLGQDGSLTSNFQNPRGIDAQSVWHPMSLAFDRDNTLWAVDHYNDRVLHFDNMATEQAHLSAVDVLGQGGSFTTATCATDPESLCGPMSLAFDAQGDAYIADSLHNRVIQRAIPAAP